MNDLAAKFYRKITSLRIPSASLKIFIANSSSRQSWLEAAQLTTDINLDIYSAPAGWQQSAQYQAAFICQQDALTNRAQFLNDAFLLKPQNSMFIVQFMNIAMSD